MYNRKNVQVRFIVYFYTQGYNSLGDPTRSLKEKHVLKYKLIRKHQLPTYRTKFDVKMTKMKQNYTVNMIMNVSETVCLFINYYPCKQELAIN